MVICKICEKDIREEKLSQHSTNCKEVAKLKEDFFPLRTKMQKYAIKAQRIKHSLETRSMKTK